MGALPRLELEIEVLSQGKKSRPAKSFSGQNNKKSHIIKRGNGLPKVYRSGFGARSFGAGRIIGEVESVRTDISLNATADPSNPEVVPLGGTKNITDLG